MSNLSPNQFALPGMEGAAHPLAKYLPHGFTFNQTEQVGDYEQEHIHSLVADHPAMANEPRKPRGGLEPKPGNDPVAELHWSGQHYGEHSSYPGEIKWVSRNSRNIPGSSGITDALHAAASTMNLADTVPVHSTDRSDEGDAWSRRVGPAHLRPPSYNEVAKVTDDEGYQRAGEEIADWRPPAGTHPFERNAGAQFTGRPGERSQKGWDGSSQMLVTPADKHLDWAFYKQPEHRRSRGGW